MDLGYSTFAEIDLSNEFFDSLREDYKGFDKWFIGKAEAGEHAYLFRNSENQIQGFLYLKIEDEEHKDIFPNLPKSPRVKVGTLKINAHGTRLGQRFIKKMVDWAVMRSTPELYVTVFDKHEHLIKLLERYGFVKWGTKDSESGTESVYIKKIGDFGGNIEKSYPLVNPSQRIFLLGIYPQYHTKLFPDSILKTETPDLVKDVSSSNSIHKIYICSIRGVENLKRNDVLVIYRTADGGTAEYTAVATTICVVEEIKSIFDFKTEVEFLEYAAPYSVFSIPELKQIWKSKRYPKIIRFTYNISLAKRPNRKSLIENVGIDRSAYAGFMELSKEQLRKIVSLGNIDESLVVN